MTSRDGRYLAAILKALKVCRDYQPKFGKGKEAGFTLAEFKRLYGRDPFYSWFGLDSPLMYSAHRAAGGMTSIYRQIGIGCQWVFQAILQDSLGLAAEQASWSYDVPSPAGKRTLSLDGRITLNDLEDKAARTRVAAWLKDAAAFLKLERQAAKNLQGVVFEVRQGYKSKDSKRQNADVANAANAYAHRYLPVNLVLSFQMDDDISERYLRARWLLLKGTLSGTPLDSAYVFSRQVLKYDLAGFFRRHSATLQREVVGVLKGLLR